MVRRLSNIIRFFCLFLLTCCQKDEPIEPLFKLLEPTTTNLNFTNQLTPSIELNIFNYMYFYNGAGLGTGDFNYDGWPDIFFAANQSSNRLLLNKGKFQFEDVTTKSGIEENANWSTGVSVVDINNDGWLDVYVCQVGEYRNLKTKNVLYINEGSNKDGIPVFSEQAAKYGIDNIGFGTQAAFFDADLDGDLDLFLLRHTLHQNGTFGKRATFEQTEHALAGDQFYECIDGKYINKTKTSGINSTVVGYGLGIVVSDFNSDHYPDIYIGNDFQENDYLYLNQKDGTFKDVLTEQINHTSRFTMGVDAGDINNDGNIDIFSLDMLPYDKEILKKSETEDAYDIFQFKLGFGYNHQYARNNLQLNNGNGTFSEIGMLADVYATDWSWSTLIQDFNLDGYKDIFVSNGIPKRMNDIDYINFYADADFQAKIEFEALEENDLSMLDKLPEVKLPNQFFINKTDLSFERMKAEIVNNFPTYSTGAAYADFDQDGDLDIVVNNINEPAYIYENLSAQKSVQINLKGSEKNRNAIGSKVKLYNADEVQVYEKYPVHGFLSSMETPFYIAQHAWQNADSIHLIWPDGSVQNISNKALAKAYTFNYKLGRKKATSTKKAKNTQNTQNIQDITSKTNLNFKHHENPFVEFNREPLIPFMVSAEGPAFAIADINGDGLEDVFIGSSKRDTAQLFTQTLNGKFTKSKQRAFELNLNYEEVDVTFEDIDKDDDQDLIIATGGNEYRSGSKYLNQLIYRNDSKGVFYLDTLALPPHINLTASTIAATDFDDDGDIDLFFGGRAVPWNYGQLPKSYLLENDGSGKFKDVTNEYTNTLSEIGFVKDALWLDINKDDRKDLILALEWDGIVALINKKDSFEKQYLTQKKGWWNVLYAYDIDEDGDEDIITGNAGLNHKFKIKEEQNIKLYFNDFDNNGTKEQILTYYINEEEVPFATKMELEKQMPFLKKKYLLAADFAKATLIELFPKIKDKSTQILKADYFSNAVLLNNGNGNFELTELPVEAQFAPIKTAIEIEKGKLLLLGNFYENNIQIGRSDASFGWVLSSKNSRFQISNSDLVLKGAIRQVLPITIRNKEAFIAVRNNDVLTVFNLDNQ